MTSFNQLQAAVDAAWALTAATPEAGPTDRDAAEAVVRRAYAAAGYRPPAVYWARSTGEARALLTDLPDVATRGKFVARRDPPRGPQRSRWVAPGGFIALTEAVDERRPEGVTDRPAQTWTEFVPERWPGPPFNHARRLSDAQRIRAKLLPLIEDREPDAAALAAELGDWAAAWWWFPGLALLVDRPVDVATDAEGRWHAAGRPALRFADGHGLHCWHGEPVPAGFWVWQAEDMLTETDPALRRAGYDYLGSWAFPVTPVCCGPGRRDDCLTQDQCEVVEDIQQQWFDRLTCTEPADRPAAEAAVRRCYDELGQPAPRILWTMSERVLAAGWGCRTPRVFDAAAVAEALKEGWLSEAERSQGLGSLLRRTARAVGRRLWVGPRWVNDRDGWLTRDGLPECSVWRQWKDWALFEAVERLLQFPIPAPGAAAVAEVLHHAAWWVPGPSLVVLGERPVAYHLDNFRRLHADGGPAIEFADGRGLNFWHQVPLPEDFWEWTPADVLAAKNLEVRRAGIERFGWTRFTDWMDLVDEQADPANPGQVLQLYDPTPAGGPELRLRGRLLVVTNASPDKGGARRQFGLVVPPRHGDALAAAADLFDLDPADYAGLERAT